jgi:predicted CoA-binding protein
MQVGIRDEAAAARLRARGCTIVMDRCLMVEHRRLGLPPRRDAASPS